LCGDDLNNDCVQFSIKKKQIENHGNTALSMLLFGILILHNIFYSDVYALCVAIPQSHSEKLYDALQTFIVQYVQNQLQVCIVDSDR
jgi:hypothetical protein